MPPGSRRGGNACQCIGSIVFISRVESDVYESLRMIVVGEERTENAVNQAGGQNLVVAGASFAFKEASGVTADGGVFLFVFHCEGHEVNALAGFFCRTYGSEEHSVAHAHLHRSIRLLGKLACLDRDLTSVGQSDGFFECL